MPDLLIRLTKRKDGSAVLHCVRADGSELWQRHEGSRARFFPPHDLTHYAVETTLRHRRGFYGLVADGWDLSDFGTPWPRGPLPPDTNPSELVVGFLDHERAGGYEMSAAEFNEQAARYYAEHRLAGACTLTDDELARVRAAARELIARWEALPPGGSLELPFDVAQRAA